MVSVLEHLVGVKKTGSDKYIARCPAHADKRPSLTIRELSDGRVLMHCFAGCDTEAVLSAIGLTFRDLMPERIGDFSRVRPAFTASDAMRALAQEAGFISVAAADVVAGKPWSETELQRLSEAVGRIRTAVEFCYGQ